MNKVVLVNIDFKDVYTGDIHRAGDKVEMSDERIAEIKEVNSEFVSVIGIVEEPEEEEAPEQGDEEPEQSADEPKKSAAKSKK